MAGAGSAVLAGAAAVLTEGAVRKAAAGADLVSDRTGLVFAEVALVLRTGGVSAVVVTLDAGLLSVTGAAWVAEGASLAGAGSVAGSLGVVGALWVGAVVSVGV